VEYLLSASIGQEGYCTRGEIPYVSVVVYKIILLPTMNSVGVYYRVAFSALAENHKGI
jgi:hypothetical protein